LITCLQAEWQAIEAAFTDCIITRDVQRAALVARYAEGGSYQLSSPEDLTLVPETKAIRLARFKREWQAIETQFAASVVERDRRRADLIKRYVEEGLTQQAMAKGLDVSQAYMSYYLEYERFCAFAEERLITAVIKDLPEFRFRQYWKQISDPQTMQTLKGKKNSAARLEYEYKVFATIAEMIQAGKPPLKPIKVVQPKTAEQLRANLDWAKATRKEAYRIYQTELRPTLKRLQGLLHADRATYSPSGQANAAYALERGMKHFLQLLTELSEAEMVALTQEPLWHYTGSGARVPILGNTQGSIDEFPTIDDRRVDA
jgi:hypothetical protein